MNKVSWSILEKEIADLQKYFDSKEVEFFRRGDGINSPVHLVVSVRSCGSREPDEAIKIGEVLIEAGNAAKNFKYNGYFVDYN